MADEIDTDAFREKLLARARDLEELSRISAEARGAVELDQASVGRVSRIDAIQQQAMALANERSRASEFFDTTQLSPFSSLKIFRLSLTRLSF